MKKLLLLALLAGCTSKANEDVTHAAVGAFLKNSLDDPDSYQPVSWGHETVYTKQDAAQAHADALLQGAAGQAKLALEYQTQASKLSGISTGLGRNLYLSNQALASKYSRQSDSLSKLAKQLAATTDTARIGRVVSHVFRTRNKTGGLVLDSARFIVLKTGSIVKQELD